MVTTLFIDISDAQGQLTPKSVTESCRIQACMVVLVTCKNKKDRSKNEGTKVVTTFFHYKSMGIFPFAQGQLTHKSLVRSSEFRTHPRYYGCPRFLQKLKRNQSKMKALEWLQHFFFQTLKGSLLHSQGWNLAKIQTHPSFYGWSCYLQE